MEPLVSCLLPSFPLHLPITSCSFGGRNHVTSQNCPVVDTVESSGLSEKARILNSLEKLYPNNKLDSVLCVWSHNAPWRVLGTRHFRSS